MSQNTESYIIGDDEERIAQLVRGAKRIAVLGIKTETHAGQPAFYVPQYLAQAGLEVIPVPVYFPDVTTILGRQVYRSVAEIPGNPVDIVEVFRRPQDIPAHLDDLIAARPKAVWMQLGIRNDEVAQRLAEAKILVVQERCLMVEHRRYAV